MKPPSTARTAGRSGGCGGACDASPLSCFLFRPRKRLEKRKKRSHTNVSNASAIRASTPPAQTSQRSSQGAAVGTHAIPAPNRAHSGLHGETGRFGWGWYHYPRSVPHVHKHPRAGYQKGVLCRFCTLIAPRSGVLPKNAESLRNSDALMRVAVPRRRGPAGLRGLFRFCRNCGLYTLRSGSFCMCEARGVSPLSACSTCRRNAGRPLVKTTNLLFPWSDRFFFDWYKISIAPEAQMKARMLCLFLL